MEIKISIIIPLYNKEKYIKNTILSIIKQNYLNYEIIIINDNSTDNSAEIAIELKRDYSIDKLFIYKNNVNKGVGISRNIGLSFSTGEYILFLDADDELSDLTFLSSINKYINKYDAKYIMTTRNYYGKYIKPKFKFKKKLFESIEHDFYKIRDNNKVALKGRFPFGGSASAVISAELIDQYRFDSEETYFEDWLFLMTIYLSNEAYFFNHISIKINFDRNSLSKNIKDDFMYQTPKLYTFLSQNREHEKLRKYFFWIWMKSIISSNLCSKKIATILDLHYEKMIENFAVNKYSIYCFIIIIFHLPSLRNSE